jgi:hypothetical protein
MTETLASGGAIPAVPALGDALALGEGNAVSAIMRPGANDNLSVTGWFEATCIDANGKVKWRESCKNLVVDAGALYMLGATFNSTTQIATASWYMGLKDTSAPAATDTLASHAGWTELTPYSGNRPLWGQGAASGTGSGNRQVTNGTNVSFTINATATVGGLFICSAASGTTGTLWNATAFSASRAVASGDTLLCTYLTSL